MTYRNVLKRRTFLRGAAGVAIALPFLDEMRASSVWAAEPAPPARAINVFFGLGVPKEIQAEGLTGCLAPLAPFADRFAWLRGINLFEANGNENNHFDGGGGCFTARVPQTESVAGGPSIDQVLRRSLHENGDPGTLVNTLMMGSFFRRKRDTSLALTRFVHCWNEDGTAVDLPIETPAELFERLFGDGLPDGPEDLKARHYDRSVLDAVLGQYQHYTSRASVLGASSKSRLSDHLDKVRELEKKIFPENLGCTIPTAPGEMSVLHGQEKDAGGGGPVLLVDEWVAWWRTMADLYALALQCDITRFGGVTFESAGERLHLQGPWDFEGEPITFDDLAHPRGKDGIHEYWHDYLPENDNLEMRWHLHFTMSQLAYLFERLDDPTYLDENGQTVLQNALVTMSTELGNGAPHDLESVFHMASTAGGRLEPGTYDLNRSATDLYNTLLHVHGVDTPMGDPDAFTGFIDELRA